jgi:hypothetical protein
MPIPTSQREFERESRRLVDAEGISELADASVLLFPLGVKLRPALLFSLGQHLNL